MQPLHELVEHPREPYRSPLVAAPLTSPPNALGASLLERKPRCLLAVVHRFLPRAHRAVGRHAA
jgi:hypothetical protein